MYSMVRMRCEVRAGYTCGRRVGDEGKKSEGKKSEIKKSEGRVHLWAADGR